MSKPAKTIRATDVCKDCGTTFERGAPHFMFCPARTCDECGTTFGAALRMTADGSRLCDDCAEMLYGE
jgi:DNA replicative helicase MCM subunit Mcm2 (Cdc46/Mcm family)